METKLTICDSCHQPVETGECICDLNLGEPEMVIEEDTGPLTAEEQLVAQKLAAKQEREDPIMIGFAGLQNKPAEDQIEEWKKLHGKIYTIGLHDDEFYIFRPLKRIEWRTLQTQLAKQVDEMKRKEAICARAILWPKLTPDFISSSFAGTMDTLYEMILQSSNFLMPQEAFSCVRKL